jgi:hypothetical protein
MGVRDLVSTQLVKIASAKLSVSTAATSNFDFGTPDDVNLAAASGAPGNGYRAGDRLLLFVTSTTAGTTDAISISVQDADDSSGSIGTPATALTDGTLTGGTSNRQFVTMIQVQAGRPWIRVRATGVGTTDTHVLTAALYAVPRGGL